MRAKLRFAIASLVTGLSACSSVKTANDNSTTAGDNPAISSTQEVATSPEVAKNFTSDQAAPHKFHHRTRAWSGHSLRPQVEGAPVDASGYWLNSYYFVRSNSETWEGLSNLLYGRPDRVELLQKWNNSPKLAAGTLVYYNSPTRPDDSQRMKIFAEDFGATLESITVKKGDTLSGLALQKYGDFLGWREIAAVNPEIVNPDLIQVGQVIRVQPAQVDTTEVLHQVIAEANKGAQKIEEADKAPVADLDAPVIAKAIPQSALSDTATFDKPETTKKTIIPASIFTNKKLSPETIAIILGAVLVLALITSLLFKRRNKKSLADGISSYDQIHHTGS